MYCAYTHRCATDSAARSRPGWRTRDRAACSGLRIPDRRGRVRPVGALATSSTHEEASMSGAPDPYGLPTADHPHYRQGIVNWPDSVPRPAMNIEKEPATWEDLTVEI